MGRKALSRKPEPKRGIAWPRWTGFRGMTIRDWLPIVGALLIPVVIAFGTWGITWQQGRIEDQRAQAERELAEQRAQDEALQAYLDEMSGLLLERDLRASEESSEVRTLARARTLTVLDRLDPSRKSALMQFLAEANLVERVDGRYPIIGLGGADLRGANLIGFDLRGAQLVGVELSEAELRFTELSEADLRAANLRGADLSEATLRGTDLSRAYLIKAYLSGADLGDVDLSSAYLMRAYLNSANLGDADLNSAYLMRAYLRYANLSEADLTVANLRGADLSDVDLSGVDLSGADLSGADLSGADGITNEELEQQAGSLEGATMPNGQKYEDWLKDREGGGQDE